MPSPADSNADADPDAAAESPTDSPTDAPADSPPDPDSSEVTLSRRRLLGAGAGTLALGVAGGYVAGARPFAPPDCDTAPVSVEADEWSFPSADRRRTSAAPARAAPSAFDERWRVEWRAFRYSRPAVADDRVFVARETDSARQTLHAFDLRDGREVWRTRYEKGGDAYSVVAAGDAVYYHTNTADRGRTAFALAMSDGSERWSSSVENYHGYAPTLVPVGGRVLLDDPTTDDESTRLLALDARSGERCWRTTLDTDALHATPAVADGRAYYTSWTSSRGDEDARGTLYAVSAADGEVTWRMEIPRGAQGPPVLGDGLAYVSSFNGPLVAISLDTGEEVWRREQTALFGSGETGTEYAHPSYELGALTGDALVARLEAYTDASDRLRAFDPETGDVLWERVAAGTDAWFTAPTAAGSDVFVAANRDDEASNRLLRLDARSGAVRESLPVDSWIHRPPTFGDGDAVFATGGSIRVFGP